MDPIDTANDSVNSFVDKLPEIFFALAAFIVFYLIATIVRIVTIKSVSRLTIQKSVINLAARIVFIVILIIGFMFALRIMNLDGVVTSMLAGAGIIGLALGFAFQDIASNFIAGIIIASQKELRVGSMIEVNDVLGVIKQVDLRMTTLLTLQGQTVYIPNKDIFTNTVLDYSELGKRRIDLACGISYGENLEHVKQVATKAIETLPHLSEGKEVSFYYSGFGDSSIDFEVFYWVDFKSQPDYLEAQSAGVMALKKAFDKEGITIPFPIRTLDFGIKGGEKLQEQIKKGK